MSQDQFGETTRRAFLGTATVATAATLAAPVAGEAQTADIGYPVATTKLAEAKADVPTELMLRAKAGDWTKPAAMAIPKEGYFELEKGRYGAIFPKTPANYGFTIIAKIKPGREDVIRAYGKKIEGAIAGDPFVLAPLKLHYLRWVLFNIGSDTYFMYQGIFDTDFDKYTEDAITLFKQTGVDTVFENLDGFPMDWKTNAPAFVKFVREHQWEQRPNGPNAKLTSHHCAWCDPFNGALTGLHTLGDAAGFIANLLKHYRERPKSKAATGHANHRKLNSWHQPGYSLAFRRISSSFPFSLSQRAASLSDRWSSTFRWSSMAPIALSCSLLPRSNAAWAFAIASSRFSRRLSSAAASFLRSVSRCRSCFSKRRAAFRVAFSSGGRGASFFDVVVRVSCWMSTRLLGRSACSRNGPSEPTARLRTMPGAAIVAAT